MQEASIVLGMDDLGVQEEVLHFLDRLPGLRVVGASDDATGLARAVREHHPDAAVVSPALLERGDLDGAAVLVVAGSETTSALRAALRAGARGFYLWPEERDALARDAERAGRPRTEHRSSAGRTIAVFGPRGGVGTTFLATNLAAACAANEADVVLVDLDPFFADATTALSVDDESAPTIAELAPVADELTSDHLERVLHEHRSGFRILLAPHRPMGRALDPAVVTASVRGLRAQHEIVLLHLPRALDEPTRTALEESDLILMVVTLDVLALRDARRAIEAVRGSGVEDRFRLVLNRVGRGEIVPDDAERVLGLRPVAMIREDRAVRRAQDRGQVMTGRSTPAARRVAALARRILQEGRSV